MRDHEYAIAKYGFITFISFAATWAQIPAQIQVLLILMGADMLLGLMIAFRNKTLSASEFVRGLFKKTAMLILIGTLHLLEQPLNVTFELDRVGSFGYLLYEAMSIVENCGRLGVPIPPALKQALEKAKIKSAATDDLSKKFFESPDNETRP